MGYDLRGKGRDFRWSFDAWPMVLRIARDHGWIPMGTKAPKGVSEWPGLYESNDHQVVRGEDARNLAVALELAVSSMTDDEWREAEVKIGTGRSSAIVEAALSFVLEVIAEPSPCERGGQIFHPFLQDRRVQDRLRPIMADRSGRTLYLNDVTIPSRVRSSNELTA
jgi:hypothetical protein